MLPPSSASTTTSACTRSSSRRCCASWRRRAFGPVGHRRVRRVAAAGTLGVLLCTPITSARIVLEKLLGVLWRLRWLYAVILAHVDLFCAGRDPLAGDSQRGDAVGLENGLCHRQRRVPFGLLQDGACQRQWSPWANWRFCGASCLLFLLPPVAGGLAPSNPQRFCEQASGYFNASPPYQLVNTIETPAATEVRISSWRSLPSQRRRSLRIEFRGPAFAGSHRTNPAKAASLPRRRRCTLRGVLVTTDAPPGLSQASVGAPSAWP